MKINLNAVILTNDGITALKQELSKGEINKAMKGAKTGESVTTNRDSNLRDVLTNVLFSPERKMDQKEKYRAWEMVRKLRKIKNEGDFNAEDIVWLKNLVGEKYDTNIMGQAWDLLEPPTKEDK